MDGGSFENRLRFLREIVEGIRKECGDYPIIVRLTIDEMYALHHWTHEKQESYELPLLVKTMAFSAINRL